MHQKAENYVLHYRFFNVPEPGKCLHYFEVTKRQNDAHGQGQNVLRRLTQTRKSTVQFSHFQLKWKVHRHKTSTLYYCQSNQNYLNNSK